MKGIDTNVLLRFFVRDDPEQFAAADAFLRQCTSSDPAFVSTIVLAEMIWALGRRYRYTRERIRSLVAVMLETPSFSFEDEPFLLSLFRTGAFPQGDFADHLIARSAARAGCGKTMTFDRDATRFVPGMELLA